jgi:hypothetical protein
MTVISKWEEWIQIESTQLKDFLCSFVAHVFHNPTILTLKCSQLPAPVALEAKHEPEFGRSAFIHFSCGGDEHH